MTTASNRPNILFILTDQQRQDSLACYGNDWIETPNLDSIADQVVRVRQRIRHATCLHS